MGIERSATGSQLLRSDRDCARLTGKTEVIGSPVGLVPTNALVESYEATNIPPAVTRKRPEPWVLDLAKVETKLKDDPSITLLVNNAGFAFVAPLLDADIEKMEDMIALNITALTRLRVRNASPSLLLAQEFLPIFRWAGSIHLTEHTREVLLRFEAASHGDIQHTQVGRAQHLFRTLHSLAQDKPVRAFAG